MGLHSGEGGGGLLEPATEAQPTRRRGPATLELPPLDAESAARLARLQERIGVSFRHPHLLREAMTHASWNNERGALSGPGYDNERLEYLGDAVLELVVGEYLFKRFPTYDEGQLTQLRAALVNTVSLARLAERLELGETLLVGRGAAKTGARQLPSLLANSFEALVGALFLDQGYRVAVRIFVQCIGDLADWTDANFKGQLQEASQERGGATPHYRVQPAGGPGHRREYVAEVVIGDDVVGEGRGKTKQAAEQAAAQAGLEQLAGAGSAVAARASGAARVAARGASGEPARVRRRVAEVAADRDATSSSGGRRRPSPVAVPAAAAPRERRGILGTLRSAAEALVGGRREVVSPPPPPASPETAEPPRARRGQRGGRRHSRRRQAPPPSTSEGIER